MAVKKIARNVLLAACMIAASCQDKGKTLRVYSYPVSACHELDLMWREDNDREVALFDKDEALLFSAIKLSTGWHVTVGGPRLGPLAYASRKKVMAVGETFACEEVRKRTAEIGK